MQIYKKIYVTKYYILYDIKGWFKSEIRKKILLETEFMSISFEYSNHLVSFIVISICRLFL